MIKSILIVEDDNDLREYLKKLLIDNDFVTQVTGDGAAAIKLIHKTPPDLVILDLGLPTVSGETVALELKKNYPSIPLLILTARNQQSDILHGFKLGADDYVSKPFAAEELIARIKARLRATGNEESALQIADLSLNSETFEVKRNGSLIPLTHTEFELLRYLMNNKGRVLSREMILNKVWLYSPDIESRVVDVYIGYLRKKIDKKGSPKLVHSIRGFGYTVKE